MTSTDTDTSVAWQALFPSLVRGTDTDPVLAELLSTARTVRLAAGSVVFQNGAPCQYYLLLTSGSVRVQLLAENGREVVLYHVRAGDSCVLTTSCLLAHEPYPALAIAETEVTALAFQQAPFERALERSATFRRFVFTGLGQRLADVIRRMEEVTFGDIDPRLASALLAAQAAGRLDTITHQALALELGTAREVVSRHLKRFAEHGWVRLGRASIALLDVAALQRVMFRK